MSGCVIGRNVLFIRRALGANVSFLEHTSDQLHVGFAVVIRRIKVMLCPQ